MEGFDGSSLTTEELAFLISILDAEDKKEFVKAFRRLFADMVDAKLISYSWYRKLMQGYAPSDELVMNAVLMDEKAMQWVVDRAHLKALRVIEIVKKTLPKVDEELLKT